MTNHNNTHSALLKMAKLAYAVMKDKDAPFHLRREASEALIEFDVCDLIFTKEAKAGISALNGLMKLSDKPGEFVTLPNGAETVAPSHIAPMLRAFREAKARGFKGLDEATKEKAEAIVAEAKSKATVTPAEPETVTMEQLRNEALSVIHQIANGRSPASSYQYDAALYLIQYTNEWIRKKELRGQIEAMEAKTR